MTLAVSSSNHPNTSAALHKKDIDVDRREDTISMGRLHTIDHHTKDQEGALFTIDHLTMVAHTACIHPNTCRHRVPTRAHITDHLTYAQAITRHAIRVNPLNTTNPTTRCHHI